MKDKQLGIKILSNFYLFLILLYILPAYLFSTQVVFLGRIISPAGQALVNGLSLLFLLFLYFSLKYRKLSGFLGAMILHLLFLLNNLLMFLEKPPILEIEGVTKGDYQLEIFAVSGGIIINLIILVYLFFCRRSFVDKE